MREGRTPSRPWPGAVRPPVTEADLLYLEAEPSNHTEIMAALRAAGAGVCGIPDPAALELMLHTLEYP